MNKQKREKLKGVRELLGRASDIVSQVLEDEQDCLDNMPENFQYSGRCESMESAIEKLEEAIENIERADECIDEASE